MKNREVGIIIDNCEVANNYKKIFFYDWNLTAPIVQKHKEETVEENHKNTIYIITIYTLTFTLIARDWRKRQWT
jgi:phosphatidylserine/phosphatidylglycerophosphate/cardiolipin synthase-like enzyme